MTRYIVRTVQAIGEIVGERYDFDSDQSIVKVRTSYHDEIAPAVETGDIVTRLRGERVIELDVPVSNFTEAELLAGRADVTISLACEALDDG